MADDDNQPRPGYWMPEGVNCNAPLRLAEAVKVAFPMGGMTVSGLRREIARGRLTSEFMAGKYFVTLAAIDDMRSLCRVPAKAPYKRADGPGRSASSGTESWPSALDAMNATATALLESLRPASSNGATTKRRRP